MTAIETFRVVLSQDVDDLRAIDDAYAQVIARATEQRRQIARLLHYGPPVVAPSEIQPERLRWRRQRLGLTQTDLGHAAALSRSAVCGIEQGKRRSPATLAHVDRVLTVLEAGRSWGAVS